MLFMSKSNDRIAIKCSCGMFSLVFKDRGVRFERSVKCLACGATADYGNLLDGYEDTRGQDLAERSPAILQHLAAPAF